MSTTQASLYAAAKEGLDKSLPLLDGLRPSNPDADPEEVAAIKMAIKNPLTDVDHWMICSPSEKPHPAKRGRDGPPSHVSLLLSIS